MALRSLCYYYLIRTFRDLPFSTVSFTNDKCVITPAPITVTTPSEEKVFDGTPLPVTTDMPVITGSINDYDMIYAVGTGTQTDAGSSPSTYEMEWGSADPNSYTVTEELGTYRVYPLEVEFDLGGTAWWDIVYDGEYHGADFGMSSDNEGFAVEQLSDTQWRVTWDWGDVIDVTGFLYWYEGANPHVTAIKVK